MDPYLDPSTGLLRNNVGARDQAELDRIEAAMSAVRAYELQRMRAPEGFDLGHLRTVHRHLFGDVYPWAGELRTVVIEKGTTRFAQPEYIDSAARDLFRQLARENNLRGLDADEFSKRAGHYLGEINVLHPFREGNGRAQRAFMGQLADGAGYHIAWDRVARDDMTRASIEAYHSGSGRMAQLIRDHLTDRDQARAIELGRARAGVDATVMHAEIGQSYTGRVIGTTKRYIVQERDAFPGEFVLHARHLVAGEVEKLQGQPAEIRYPQGDVGIAMPAKQKGIDGIEKTKKYDRGLDK